jgi:hypothetical protein
MGLLYLLLE